MSVSRRSVLLSGLSLAACSIAGTTASFAQSGRFANPLIVTITGIPGDAEVSRLNALAAAFLKEGIAVTLSVSPFTSAGAEVEEGAALPIWLRQRLVEYPDLFEAALHLDQIASTDGFRQLRQCSEAQAAFCRAFNSYDLYRVRDMFMAQTVTTRSPMQTAQDGSSLRAAGVRTVIRLFDATASAGEYQPAEGAYWFSATGLVNIVSPQKSAARQWMTGAHADVLKLSENIQRLSAGDQPVVVELLWDHLRYLSQTDLADLGTSTARILMQEISALRVRSVTADRLYRQSRPQAARYVIVRVDDLRASPTYDRDQTAFTQQLIRSGVPLTEAVIPAPHGHLLADDQPIRTYLDAMLGSPRYDLATHGMRHTASEMLGLSIAENASLVREGVAQLFRATGRVPVAYIPPNNAFDENTVDGLAANGVRMLSADKRDFKLINGLDRQGILHVSNTVGFELDWSASPAYRTVDQVMQCIGSKNDAVLMIHRQTADTPAKIDALGETVERLAREPGTKLVNFDEYYRAVTTDSPAMSRIQTARAAVNVVDWTARPLTARIEAELKEDAAKAWAFFDWGAKNFDGLVPATAWIEDGKQQGYPFVTMWDLASFLMGAMAAHRLGMIGQREFEASIDRILKFAGASDFKYAGVRLPRTERALGKKNAPRDGFDCADTGRLLIALKALDVYSGGAFPTHQLVSGWGLDAVLTGGEIHSVSPRGRAASKHQSSYAGYASQGFRMWGFDLKPVFGAAAPETSMESAVDALAEIGRRGRIATEPHLTEEIEIGASPFGRFASDILHEAQMRRYAETGVLTCASELPIPRAPYFTYQSYQPGGGNGDFVVDAQSESDQKILRRRKDETRMVSVKGAYLWYATRPGRYSDALMQHVRKRLDTPLAGLPSGIGESSGKPTVLTDIDTNGIVLEAIAFVLGGGVPLLSSGASKEASL